MERLQVALPPEIEILLKKTGVSKMRSPMEYEQWKADRHNEEPGKLTGYDCSDCKNRGYFRRVNELCQSYNERCGCMEMRESLRQLEKSGISELVERYTFDAWKTEENWQKRAVQLALDYSGSRAGQWFAMCGRPGTGKTHLCTAICGEYLKRGIGVRYMLWRDVAVRAKGYANDPEVYEKIVAPLKRVDVLYIDDLLKTGKENAKIEKGEKRDEPTAAEVRLAFEILNARYNDTRKRTIISSERSIERIMDFDEATGSRIYERSKGFYMDLNKVDAKNWRLNG